MYHTNLLQCLHITVVHSAKHRSQLACLLQRNNILHKQNALAYTS